MIVNKFSSLAGIKSYTKSCHDERTMNEMDLYGAYFDTVYATHDDLNISGSTSPTIPSKTNWDDNTILDCEFTGNLQAGNSDFARSQISKIRIKRTEKDKLDWITLKEISATEFPGARLTYFDYTARGQQDYSYAIVPVYNETSPGVEGNEGQYKIVEASSKFNGLWICGKDIAYNALLDLRLSVNRNHTTSTTTTLGNRYPYVNKYGNADYHSGTINACFIRMNCEECTFDIDGGARYREELGDFLLDGQPKIIKHEDGRIWLASIVDAVSMDDGDDSRFPTYSINFVEIGRYDNTNDLYEAGIIDTNI